MYAHSKKENGPAGLVRLLLLFRRDPLRGNVLAVFRRVEQYALLTLQRYLTYEYASGAPQRKITLEFLYSMTALHLPEISPVSVLPRRIRP